MAWLPIQFTVPQYEDTNGDPASGYVLKAYAAGTSTNIPFATDSTGATQVSSIALNANGYPAVSGNIVIPHIDQSFKLALYPTQAAADANSGAIWNPDDLTPVSNVGFGNGVNPQTVTYALLGADEGKLILFTGAGGVELDLLAVADADEGFAFLVENNTSGTVTLDPSGSELVNGAATFALLAGESAIVICTGSAWRALVLSNVRTNTANTFTAVQTLSGAAINFAEGSDVVSAATTNIWSTTGNTVHVTGSTGPITSLGTAPQAGAMRWVIFDSTPTLTHSANLNLPGGVSRTAAAGDAMLVYADTTTQHDVLVYSPATPGPVDAQTFNSSGTWTKPTGYGANSFVVIECWAGGGSGGKAAIGGGGGGGGSYMRRERLLSNLGATETVTVGAGGASQTTANTSGNNGGTTSFGAHLSTYGGGGGNSDGTGGGGGSGAAGGSPTDTGGGDAGAGGAATTTGRNSVYGGGGGGGGNSVAPVGNGGVSAWGGGGGGAGSQTVAGGTGGASRLAGAGGAGTFDGGSGTAGTQPSGGGGGSESGNSGAGGDGRVVVTVYNR